MSFETKGETMRTGLKESFELRVMRKGKAPFMQTRGEADSSHSFLILILQEPQLLHKTA